MHAASRALRDLRGGVTTARDMGSHGRFGLDIRDAIEAGDVPGPRLTSPGTWLSGVGGHPQPYCREVSGADEMRRAVEDQLALGADFIKIVVSGGVRGGSRSAMWESQLNEEELSAAVSVARSAGVPVAAHAHPLAAVRSAVAAGVTSVEHASELDRDVLTAMIARGVFIVPTFAVYEMMRRELAGSDASPDLERLWSVKVECFMIALASGVAWALGSDSAGMIAIDAFCEELIVMNRLFDIPAVELLERATKGNAELLGLTGVGSIEPGTSADIAVIDADPVRDLEALRRVSITVSRGELFEWRR
jgi:imidazolonepropionase-like amidohydrolase